LTLEERAALPPEMRAAWDVFLASDCYRKVAMANLPDDDLVCLVNTLEAGFAMGLAAGSRSLLGAASTTPDDRQEAL
jgi:hypothetical protein